MIISVSGHIHLVMKEVENVLNSFTYPVFINAKNKRPDLIASSVVIKIDSSVFLVTAAHVLDQVSSANSPFYIAIINSFVALEGNFIRSATQGKDHFDIAFIKLSDEFINSNNISILGEDNLMINKCFESVHLSLIHGYPCSKNKQGSALKCGTKFHSSAYTYGGKIDRDFNQWEKFNKHKNTHTCMNYGRAKDIYGEINNPPSPRGISGGGLWFLPNLFSLGHVYLEGIFIEYYEKDNISFSTKIEKVAEFIRNNS